MRRRTALAILTQSALVLAGCSSSDETGDPNEGGTTTPTETPTDTPTEAPTDTPTETSTETPTPEPEYEFDATVEFPVGGVVGEPVPIEVTATNTGEEAGDFEATLTHDGSDLASDSVRVAPGESATLTLEHAFDATGDYDVAVADAEATLTIYPHELRFVHAVMTSLDTLRIEKEVRESGRIDTGEGPTDWEKTSTTTVEKNFDAETLYEKSEDDLVYGSTQLAETVEQWVVDGVLYERTTKHTEGGVAYDKRSTDRPRAWSALDIHGTDTEGFLSFQHTDQEYVFVFDPGTSEEATALARRIIGSGGLLPAEKTTDARLELRYDRGTGRAKTYESDLTIEGAERFPELERSLTDDHVAYGEPVDVTVPEDVKENTD